MEDQELGFNLTHLLNETNIKLYLEITEETKQFIETSGISYEDITSFTWNPVLFQKDKLKIDITMSYPLIYS